MCNKFIRSNANWKNAGIQKEKNLKKINVGVYMFQDICYIKSDIKTELLIQI